MKFYLSKTKRLILVGLFVLVIILINHYYDFSFVRDLEELRRQVNEVGLFAPIFFIFLYVLATVTLLPVTILVIVSGLIFGFWNGLLYTMTGAIIGSTIAFYIAKFTKLDDWIERRILNSTDKVKKYKDKILSESFTFIIFLRLIPLISFGGLSYALGVTKVNFWPYFMATFLTTLAGNAVFVYIGEAIVEFKLINIVIIFIIYSLFFLLTVGASKALKRYKNK